NAIKKAKYGRALDIMLAGSKVDDLIWAGKDGDLAPGEYSLAQNTLGLVFEKLGDLGDKGLYIEARKAFDLALAMSEKSAASGERKRTANYSQAIDLGNLARIVSRLGNRDDAERFNSRAIEKLEAAIERDGYDDFDNFVRAAGNI